MLCVVEMLQYPGVLYPPVVVESTPWKVTMALMSPACVGSAGGGRVESRVESLKKWILLIY